jgi:hypothetical protein
VLQILIIEISSRGCSLQNALTFGHIIPKAAVNIVHEGKTLWLHHIDDLASSFTVSINALPGQQFWLCSGFRVLFNLFGLA